MTFCDLNENGLYCEPFSLHGGSGGIGPNADTTIEEVAENRSVGEIDLPGRLVLEIARIQSMHVPRKKK